MRRKALASAVCALLATAMGLSGTALAGATANHRHSSGSSIKFKHGKPTLKSMTIAVINAAGSAHIGDTNVHDWVKIMQSWGANVSQTNASHNAGELAVEGGKATVSVGPLPTQLDAGLTVFGPNMIHLTDDLYGKTTIKSLKGLKGKTIAFCCTASPDGIMLHAIFHKTGLNRGTVKLLSTGASTSSMDALIAGKVTAAFFAGATLPATATGKFRMLTSASKLLPEYADSFMASTPSWLKSHKQEAIAVDLAWLASAKLFDKNENQWVKDAETYTATADPGTAYTSAYKQLKTLNGWPVAKSAYTKAAVAFNYNAANQLGTITGLGKRPISKTMTVSAWNEAWKLWTKYGKKL